MAAVEAPLAATTAETGTVDGIATSGSSNPTGDNITVFHDADNFNVKHPLANTWTLWFTKPPRNVCEPPNSQLYY